MAVWGNITARDKPRREDMARFAFAALIALGLHLSLFKLMMFKTPAVLEVKEDFIAIELVTMPPAAKTVQTPPAKSPETNDAPLAPPPKVKPAPPPPLKQPPAQSVVTDAPDILASTRRATAEDAGSTVSQASESAKPIPNQKSVDEQRIDEGLKSLAAELSCLKGFSEECAETRKGVFDEFQMTETDKVYTKKYAHTGMPAEFYGMSERQIRAKLNVPNAGENGIYIPLTNIGINGGWLDAMHGVNKGCEWKAGIDKNGNHQPIKDCPNYLPAAKEDRDRRNKFQARLKANEARRNNMEQP